MIFHPRLGTLVRAARTDREGNAVRPQGRLASHLARCPRCRERIGWARGVREAVREETRRAAPAASWERIAERLDAQEHVLLPVVPAAGERARRWAAPARRAAAAAMLFAGAAAAAVPGSPVRAWVERALTGGDVPGGEAAAPPPDPDAPAAVTFLIPALDGGVTIALERSAPALRVRVRLGGAGEVEIMASGPAAAARFSRAPGRLTIQEAGAGELVVGLPPDLRATILVDGRPMVRMRDGELVLSEAVQGLSATELVFRVGARRDAP